MAVSTTMVQAGRHQIEVNVFSAGKPAVNAEFIINREPAANGGPVVVIEPSWGGFAGDWRSIAEAVARQTTVVTYDRAPYGASSRARDRRTPADIAGDLHAVLRAVDMTGPFVLVGHSLGGIYMRTYAALYPDEVAGMVLVESSHEGQTPLLNAVFTWKVKLAGVTMYPRLIFSTRKSREGGDRWSMLREWWTSQRITADDRPLAASGLGGKPLIVLTRSDGGPFGGRQWQVWHGFHAEQALLSANSRHVISVSTDHYLNSGDPELVIAAINEVVRSAGTGTPLRDLAEPGTPSD